MKPYQVMQAALKKVDRDILYSLCQYGAQRSLGMGSASRWQFVAHDRRYPGQLAKSDQYLGSANTTRRRKNRRLCGTRPLERYRYDDRRRCIRSARAEICIRHDLTRDEQYTHVSLWSLLAAPLLIGCDMTKFDDFTLSLLTNDEVLAVNQDPLGKQATRVKDDPAAGVEIWARPLPMARWPWACSIADAIRSCSPRTRTSRPAANQRKLGDLFDRSTRESTEFPTRDGSQSGIR